MRAENEVTKILQTTTISTAKMGIAHRDQELEQMKESTDIAEIKEEVEEIIKKEDPL